MVINCWLINWYAEFVVCSSLQQSNSAWSAYLSHYFVTCINNCGIWTVPGSFFFYNDNEKKKSCCLRLTYAGTAVTSDFWQRKVVTLFNRPLKLCWALPIRPSEIKYLCNEYMVGCTLSSVLWEALKLKSVALNCICFLSDQIIYIYIKLKSCLSVYPSAFHLISCTFLASCYMYQSDFCIK